MFSWLSNLFKNSFTPCAKSGSKYNGTYLKGNKMNSKGKAGTITADEFETLSGMVQTYGARTLGQKVSKVCTKIADGYKHEFPNSNIAKAWAGSSSRVVSVLGSSGRSVPQDVFEFLCDLVSAYGPETVTNKLAKIATRNNTSSDASILKTVFPTTSASR